MSDVITNLYEKFSGLPRDNFPDFVVNNEMQKQGIKAGDYKPRFDRKWGDGAIKFDFDKYVKWDFEKSKQLQAVVGKYPRFEVIQPKFNLSFIDLVANETPVTEDMIYNNFIIFDRKDYEKGKNIGYTGMAGGFNRIMEEFVLNEDYVPHSYVDNITGESAKTREEVLQMIPDRIAATVDSNSIRASLNLLEVEPNLVEDIGSKFFDAKTE